VIDTRSWVVAGTYRSTLVQDGEDWVLTGLEFRFKYQLGETDLPAEAQARATG